MEEAGDGAASMPAITQPHQKSLTLTGQVLPQQPGDKPNAGADVPDQAVLTVPELQLRQLMNEKEQLIYDLEEEQCVLIYQIQQIQTELTEETKDKDHIAGLLSGSEWMRKTAAQNVDQLRKTLKAEREKTEAAETRLAKEEEATSQLRSALAQAEDNLEKSLSQSEKARSVLLQENLQATSSLTAALTKAQEDLELERRLWSEEKSDLQESLWITKQALDEEEEARNKFMDELMGRIKTVENHVLEAQNLFLEAIPPDL
ncbi:hypothetical protein F2P81_020500 [Scophthalmus maximus]|uniref:Uncharacterized protein n=1 Tax=Scophthalmus maximus TaxID=52904 RepID=A0A6A4S5C5_SCOMX|nr:hypothetical protein F2P81_020500 [Scophthalmus maximus]